MASFNKVLLMGNLTRDPELRYTSGGSPVCNFGIAMNRKFSDKSGEKREETTYIRITVWGKQGENCAQYLSKGRGVLVEGRLRSRSWETDDGQKRSTVEVVADSVTFLPGRGGGSGGGSSNYGDADIDGPPAEDDIPF